MGDARTVMNPLIKHQRRRKGRGKVRPGTEKLTHLEDLPPLFWWLSLQKSYSKFLHQKITLSFIIQSLIGRGIFFFFNWRREQRAQRAGGLYSPYQIAYRLPSFERQGRLWCLGSITDGCQAIIAPQEVLVQVGSVIGALLLLFLIIPLSSKVITLKKILNCFTSRKYFENQIEFECFIMMPFYFKRSLGSQMSGNGFSLLASKEHLRKLLGCAMIFQCMYLVALVWQGKYVVLKNRLFFSWKKIVS